MSEHRFRLALSRPWAQFLVAGLGLTLLIAAAFWRTPELGFVHFDDDDYVLRNPVVHAGLSWQGLRWAFTTQAASNWHPLTWLSHMLDCQLYGLDPAGHHLSAVVLHLIAALLLFRFFQRTTGRARLAFALAALFAVHPLRVESVAWIAERKDVLSGVFWFATLCAYAWYARRPDWRRYGVVLLLFGIGLLAKPMLVSLPLVLLLLDYWPLNRLASPYPAVLRLAGGNAGLGPGVVPGPPRSLRFLLLEKAPLLALAAGSCLATVAAQEAAIGAWETYPLPYRLMNALSSLFAYLGKWLWPMRLSVYYPHPGPEQSWIVAGACGLALAWISTLAVLAAQRRGWALVGWYWYLVTLVPVIGLVQVGPQAMADRYTYIPLVGITVLLVWGLAELLGRTVWSRRAGVVALVLLLACLVWRTQDQTRHWKDAGALFRQALSVAPSDLAHNNLGNALARHGRDAEAMEQYRRALTLNPGHAPALANLGILLARHGQWARAAEALRRSLELAPNSAPAHAWLGISLAGLGEYTAALEHLNAALQLDPDLEDAQRARARMQPAQDGRLD